LVYKVLGNASIYDIIIDEPYWDGFRASQKSVLYCRTSKDEIVVADVMVSRVLGAPSETLSILIVFVYFRLVRKVTASGAKHAVIA
jgi:hypothetical protein